MTIISDKAQSFWDRRLGLVTNARYLSESDTSLHLRDLRRA